MLMDTEERRTELGAIRLGGARNIYLRVMLYQKVSQHVSFVWDDGDGTTRPNMVPPLDAKEIRQLRRILGKAENRIRKLFGEMEKR